jgi:RAD51-like protein 1
VSALDLWHATTADLSTILPINSNSNSNSNNNNNTIGEKMRYLPTGWPRLDHSVGGGIRMGTVTELVGRAGVGKTQLAMQLCLEAAKYNQATMYMDTEHKVSLERLREMSLERYLQGEKVRRSNDDGEYHHNPILMHHHDWNHLGTEHIPPAEMQEQPQQSPSTKQFHYKRPEDIAPNLVVRTPGTTSELLSSLESAEAEIWNRNQQPQHDDNSNTSGVSSFPIRLLIVDSIAAPMKRDFGSDSAPQRAAAVFQCAQTLKRLADQLHLAVVVINQVGLADSTRNDPPGGVSVRAALGTSWHHCVSTRLLMEHEVDLHHNHTGGGVVVNHHGGHVETTQPARRLSIVKSNVAAFSTMWFQVTKMGIVEATRQDEEMEEWTQ